MQDEVYLLTEEGIVDRQGHELHNVPFAGRKVRAGAAGEGSRAVLVGDGEIWLQENRSAPMHEATWHKAAESRTVLNCLLWADDRRLFIGATDARLFMLDEIGLRIVEPFNQIPERGQWTTPWGGPADIRSLALSRKGRIYVNVHVGWISMSEDDGASWKCLTDGLEKDVHQVATHPDRDEVVLAATADGLFFSGNRGMSFESRSDGVEKRYQRACVVFPGSGTLLCSTSRGPHGDAQAMLFQSEDDGKSWRRAAGLPDSIAQNIDTHQLAAVSEQTAYAVINDTELWRSDDRGRVWEREAVGLPRVYGFMR